MAKKNKLPPRPDCGSIEINKMIRAINRGETVNPCPGSAERDRWWAGLNKNKEDFIAYEKAHGHDTSVIVMSLMEPDYYEECLMESMMPDGYEDMIDALKKQ